MCFQKLNQCPYHVNKLKLIPFDFVLEYLSIEALLIRPMFGCHAVYTRGKIVLILRQRKDFPNDNGVWLATIKEHHLSLKKDFSPLRSISLFGDKPSGWQNLPADADDFEKAVIKACELILKGDPRIGKIPKLKKGKTVKNSEIKTGK